VVSKRTCAKALVVLLVPKRTFIHMDFRSRDTGVAVGDGMVVRREGRGAAEPTRGRWPVGGVADGGITLENLRWDWYGVGGGGGCGR
jgi:hypothetical protein